MKNLNVRYLEKQELDKWDEFVEISPYGNIFNKSYWLNAVSSDFKILIAEENGKILGGIALPSVMGKFYRNPKLTPQLGILIGSGNSDEKYSTRVSKEIEISNALIKSLPKFKQFNYNFSYDFNNFLPFIWEGYNVTTNYTYVIDDLSDIDKTYSEFQYDTKYIIKKAIKNGVSITSEYGIKEFYEVNRKTFTRQNMEMPYDLDFLLKLDNVLENNSNRKILFALNSNKEIIAASYFLYDKECTYYLMGGADPEQRKTGAQALLLWEGIKFASTVSKKFDFEGSMIKGVERVFREFGGKQKIIHNVYKSDIVTELLYSFAKKNKDLVRKFLKV